MKQAQVFLGGEAGAWLRRNNSKLPTETDPVFRLIKDSGINPTSALEVGCANGWRLRKLQEEFGCKIFGVDPGAKTIDPLWMRKGTADDLRPQPDGSVDLLIYGFCLYLCDREDLFKIAAEGDRVLKDGGYLIVHDFHAAAPHARHYKHRAGVFSYKTDHSKLWLGNPAYNVFRRLFVGEGDELTSVVFLKKNLKAAWPVHD